MARTKRRIPNHCLRRPHTLNEKKAEQGPLVRAKRNSANLPSAWDDMYVSAYSQCCKRKNIGGQWKYFEVNTKP